MCALYKRQRQAPVIYDTTRHTAFLRPQVVAGPSLPPPPPHDAFCPIRLSPPDDSHHTYHSRLRRPYDRTLITAAAVGRRVTAPERRKDEALPVTEHPPTSRAKGVRVSSETSAGRGIAKYSSLPPFTGATRSKHDNTQQQQATRSISFLVRVHQRGSCAEQRLTQLKSPDQQHQHQQ